MIYFTWRWVTRKKKKKNSIKSCTRALTRDIRNKYYGSCIKEFSIDVDQSIYVYKYIYHIESINAINFDCYVSNKFLFIKFK